MKLHLKFQITKFMLLILSLILVNSPILLKAKNPSQKIKKENSKNNKVIEVKLPEDAFDGEIELDNSINTLKKKKEKKKKKSYNSSLKEYQIKQGETQLIIISNLGLNHIKTNINHPTVYTASDVKITIDGYNIYINALQKVKPIDLFIEAPNGNVYSLTLIPKQVPPQSLYFRAVDYNETPAEENKKFLKKSIGSSVNSLLNYPYIEHIKGIIKKMALNQEIQGFIKTDYKNNSEVQEFNDLISRLITKYIGSEITGEVWLLKNIGITPITISPKDFYSKDVLAVAVELKKNLKSKILYPDESCIIYIIKKNNFEEVGEADE